MPPEGDDSYAVVLALPGEYSWLPRIDRDQVWSTAPKNQLAAAWQCALIALALAIPAVERAVGVPVEVSATLVGSYGLRSLVQAFFEHRLREHPRLASGKLLFEVIHGVAVVVGLVIASGDPMTPLWALGVAYAALDGSDFEFPPLVSYAALHSLAPLVSIPFFLAAGQPAHVAVFAPMFFALVNFVSYHYTASRKGVVRLAFRERDGLREQLAAQRASIERERIMTRLVDSLGTRLESAEVHLPALRAGTAGQAQKLAHREIAHAARQGLTELRSLLSGLDAEPGARAPVAADPPRPHEPVYRHWLPRFQKEMTWDGTPADLVSAIILCLLLAGALAIPQCAAVFGLRRSIAVPVVLLFPLWLSANLILLLRNPKLPMTRRRLFGLLLLGVTITCTLPLASGDPTSPLWALAVMYAAFNSTNFEIQASYGALASHVVGPLLTIPFFVILGAEPSAAVAGPLLFSVVSFVMFHFGALRAKTVREARTEREDLKTQIVHERSVRYRERIARDLHDSVGAQLSLAAIYADLLEQRRDDPDAVRTLSDAMAEAAEQSLSDLRELIEGLSREGSTLSDLAALLRRRCATLASATRIDIQVRDEANHETRLSPAARYALLRIAQEALCNTVRHTQARTVELEFVATGQHARLRIADDGQGFDQAAPSRGRGLHNMRRRAEELGGKLHVETSESGTTIEAHVPAS